MAIAFVQTASNAVSAATVCATTLGSNTTAGTLVVLVITTSSTSVTLSTITFTGNADVPVAAPNSHTAPAVGQIWIYYVLSGAGGASAVVVTTSSASNTRVTVSEYSATSAWVFDNAAHNSGGGNITSNVTITGTADLIVGGCLSNCATLTDGGITGGAGGTTTNRFANSTNLVDDRFTVVNVGKYSFVETDAGGGTTASSIAAFRSGTTPQTLLVDDELRAPRRRISALGEELLPSRLGLASVLAPDDLRAAPLPRVRVADELVGTSRAISSSLFDADPVARAPRRRPAIDDAFPGHITLPALGFAGPDACIAPPKRAVVDDAFPGHVILPALGFASDQPTQAPRRVARADDGFPGHIALPALGFAGEDAAKRPSRPQPNHDALPGRALLSPLPLAEEQTLSKRIRIGITDDAYVAKQASGSIGWASDEQPIRPLQMRALPPQDQPPSSASGLASLGWATEHWPLRWQKRFPLDDGYPFDSLLPLNLRRICLHADDAPTLVLLTANAVTLGLVAADAPTLLLACTDEVCPA